MLIRIATSLLLGGAAIVSGVAAARTLLAKILLARGCVEDLGYHLGVDGATMTEAGCAIERAGQTLIVPEVPIGPIVYSVATAVVLLALAGLALALPANVWTVWAVVIPAVSACAATALGYVSLRWWRGYSEQRAFCRDVLGGTATDWSYCRAPEHGAVPLVPTWPLIASFVATMVTVGVMVASLVHAGRLRQVHGGSHMRAEAS